jgi:hypothetical protein
MSEGEAYAYLIAYQGKTPKVKTYKVRRGK